MALSHDQIVDLVKQAFANGAFAHDEQTLQVHAYEEAEVDKLIRPIAKGVVSGVGETYYILDEPGLNLFLL